ncbi:MAG: NADH-quinone oxidoreductase subunit N [Thermoplasmatota archaeon]
MSIPAIPAELVAVSPQLVLVAGAIVVALVGAAGRSRRGLLATLAVITVAIAAILAVATVHTLPGLGGVTSAVHGLSKGGLPPQPYGLLEITDFTVLFELVFLGVAGIVCFAGPSTYEGRQQGEFYALLLLATSGMLVVAAARELLTLFLGLELSAFATYALAAFNKNSAVSAEAAMKYFIIGSLSSALTLFGISLLYGQTGDTTFVGLVNYATFLQRTGVTPLAVFTWGFLIAGFAFKIAAVPFHMWAPDVYDGAPSSVSAFLVAGSKNTGFVALFKIFIVGLFAIKGNWDYAVAILAVLTMTVGNVLAIAQDNLKRMLAYSSIAQAGYILIALPVATPYAVAGGIFHIITQAVMKSGAFIALAGLSAVGIAETMDGIKGLGKRAPLVALSITILMLSFAGVPPLAGFASKFFLFSSVFQVNAGPSWLVWLAIAGIINSAISLFYYAQVIRMMYLEETPGYVTAPAPKIKMPFLPLAALVICALLTIALGFFAQPMMNWSLQAAYALGP